MFSFILIEYNPEDWESLFEQLSSRWSGSDVTSAASWQTINSDAVIKEVRPIQLSPEKLNSPSAKLMQYPVSHSPQCPRSPTILKKKKKKKKTVGVEGAHNHGIVLSREV